MSLRFSKKGVSRISLRCTNPTLPVLYINNKGSLSVDPLCCQNGAIHTEGA